MVLHYIHLSFRVRDDPDFWSGECNHSVTDVL